MAKFISKVKSIQPTNISIMDVFEDNDDHQDDDDENTMKKDQSKNNNNNSYPLKEIIIKNSHILLKGNDDGLTKLSKVYPL